MFEPDHSGTFGWLSALIVLVMVGIGLSLLVDRRFELSSSDKQLKVDVEKNFAVLEGIRIKHDRALGELTELEKTRSPQAKELSKLQEQGERAKERMIDLNGQVGKLQSAVAAVQKEFEGYASEYRNQVWQAAVGEKQAFIAFRDGRRYEDVTILRVTAVGMEISHRDGRARIDFKDLDASWQERFLWNSSERNTALAGENEVPQPPAVQNTPSTPKGFKPASKAPATVPDPTATGKLRADLIGWNNKILMLKMQLQEAQSNIGSKQKSPPGSLETWQQRANRLSAELNQAKVNRDMAQLKLAAVAPSDPLSNASYSDY
ncbi:MAG: hypothetical protein CFE26_09960 [Verrucomicrobiales bacterium VVV1]|nr:MAG: hypothetical protein CFE26_09960 [Verrucomicrobiales bacterium VVV1]